jgi:transposase-like protein
MNNEEWLRDGRKIPDEVKGYIRKIAVEAVRERGQSPEVVAEIFNFNRSCIYRWLNQYDAGGYDALESSQHRVLSPWSRMQWRCGSNRQC